MYEENGQHSSTWKFITEANSQENAVDISKKYLINLFSTNGEKIKWLICEKENIAN